jgi:hypothetical protein
MTHPTTFGRAVGMVAVALGLVAVMAVPASAHGGESDSAEELVLTAIAILEVHPTPGAAVEDKINDAQEAKDLSGVRMNLVRAAGDTLHLGDVATTKRLLEQSVGACPDADILYVSDQDAKPPCVAPAHSGVIDRRALGGTTEVVLLIVAGLLALAGVAIVRHPRVRSDRGAAVS